MGDQLVCIFCQIIGGEAPATVLYEDEKTVAFMDINPATDGHALIVSRQHAPTILELDDDSLAAVALTTKKIAKAVKSALSPDGINLIQANGQAAFQTVDHFHMHVVPRWITDGIVQPWVPTPGDPERIASTAEKIVTALG